MKRTILEKLEPEEILELTGEMETLKEENRILKSQAKQQKSKLQEYESLISQTEQDISDLTLKYEKLANSNQELRLAKEEREKAESIRTQTELSLKNQTRLIETRITRAESIEASADRKQNANQRKEEQLEDRENKLNERERKFEFREKQYEHEIWETAARQSRARRERYDKETAQIKEKYERRTDEWIYEYGLKYTLLHILCGIYTLIWIIYSVSFRTDIANAASAVMIVETSLFGLGSRIAGLVHIPLWLLNSGIQWIIRIIFPTLPVVLTVYGVYKFALWFHAKLWDNVSLAFGFGIINLIPLSDMLHRAMPFYNSIVAFIVATTVYVIVRSWLKRPKWKYVGI